MAQPDSTSKSILNPFDGDIFPGTVTRNKLYLAAMKEETDDSKWFSLTAADHTKFRAPLEQATHAYSWGAIVLAIPLEYNNTNNSISFGDLVLDLDENLFESIQFNAALIWAAIDFNAMLFDDQDIVNNDPVNNKDDGMKFQLWLYQQCSMEDIGHHLDANIVGKLIPFFLYILELIFQAIIMPLEWILQIRWSSNELGLIEEGNI